MRFKSRGGILGKVAGTIAAATGADVDEDSDDDDAREWFVSAASGYVRCS